MRLAFLACLCLALVPVSTHGEEQANQPSQQKQKGANPPQAQAAPSTTPSSTVRQPTAEAIDNGKAEKQTYWQHAVSPEILPTWLILVVGIFGVLLAWRTLKDLETQTKALIKSAQAAQKYAEASEMSVRALTNIYRAWILFDWTSHSSNTATFDLSIKNWGKTPAKLECISIVSKVLTEDELINLSVLPKEQLAHTSFPIILAPGDSFRLPGGSAEYDAGKELPNVHRNTKMVVWYGVVVYRDMLTPDTEHRTRFCYRYNSKRAGLHAGGPPEYNETT
jgi:hypothetical protein